MSIKKGNRIRKRKHTPILTASMKKFIDELDLYERGLGYMYNYDLETKKRYKVWVDGRREEG